MLIISILQLVRIAKNLILFNLSTFYLPKKEIQHLMGIK